MRTIIRHLIRATPLFVLVVFAPSTAAGVDLAWLELTLSPYAGLARLDETAKQVDRVGPLLGGRAGVTLFKRVGLEGTVGYIGTDSRLAPESTFPIQHLGVDLVVNLLPDRRLNPYLAAGWSQLNFDEPDNLVLNLAGREFGGGVKFALKQGKAHRVDLRLDVRDVVAKNDIQLTDVGETKHHLLTTLGLQISLSKPDRDSDLDGVVDRLDRCEGTPLGALVDEYGCSRDSDGDGIADGIDQCPDTPRGVWADETGCARDSDGDGVLDGVDRCAQTPPEFEVDEAGCPKDTDGDGVFDGVDRCPDTERGVRVDEEGCPLPSSARETELLDTGTLVVDNIYFDSGQAELKPASYPALDEVGAILLKWPDLQFEIGGHTDDHGYEDYNEALSLSRAQAVLKYILETFPALEPARFRAKGYGETEPIATNMTAEGRSQNRRVEFRVLNRGVLSRDKD